MKLEEKASLSFKKLNLLQAIKLKSHCLDNKFSIINFLFQTSRHLFNNPKIIHSKFLMSLKLLK